MNISFALTEDELLAGLKRASRRRWKTVTASRFRKGTVHTAWSRIPRVPGARKLAVIRATADAYLEPLGRMTPRDLEEEGGMCETVEEFIMLVEGTPEEELYVVCFEVVEYLVPQQQREAARRRIQKRRKAA
jgi:hypothetical protein